MAGWRQLDISRRYGRTGSNSYKLVNIERLKKKMDKKTELQEIIAMLKTVKTRLDNLITLYEEQDEDNLILYEAAAALSDTVELVEEEYELS